MAERKISELESTTDLQGLYTIGTDKNNNSKKVKLQFVKEAADYANAQGDYAKEVADNTAGNTGVNDYPAFSASGIYVAGDVVNYNGKLYRFTAPHQSGTWNGNDVVPTSINAESQRKLTELSEEIRIFTNDASYPSQWDSAIRFLALNSDATINISEIYVLVYNGTIQLWAYNSGNIVWQSVTNLDAIAEGSIFPLKTESNAFTGVVALLSLRNKNELVDWGSLSAKLNINVLINSFPYIYANAINKDSFQYAAVIDNIKDTSVIDRESGYIENRIADDVVELYVLPNARFGINKLALVDDSNAFHLWGYDNNNIIWRCDLPFSSFENGVVMPIECTSDGGNVVRHEVVAYIVFSNIEDYKTLSDGSVRVLTWEKVTNIVYNSHILNYFLSNTSENQKIDDLEERLVNIEDNITVEEQEKSEVVLGRASEGWVEHFFDKPIPKGAVIANVGMYPYPAVVYLTDEHGDIVVEEQLKNIRSSVPYTTTKAYRGYKGNEDAKFAIFLEGENGKTRKSINITSSMSQIDIYNAMWFAFHEGDVDVFFETGIYEFTDELFAYIKYTLDLSYTVGLPIGNGCRYFFNNSTLKATAQGEYYHNQNILDTQAQAGDFELHDVILDGTGVTYCVHDEAQGEDTPCMHKYDNVTFIINDAYACIGMGTGYNETVILENCIFKPSQFVQHAPTNNTGDKVVTNNYYIRGCYFDGKVFDIGTAQLDKSRDKISMCISNCAMKGKIGTSQEFLSEYIEFNNTLL